MSHYIITEDQVNDIIKAIHIHQVIIDLGCGIHPKAAVSVDAEALVDLMCVARDLLPEEKDLQFVSR